APPVATLGPARPDGAPPPRGQPQPALAFAPAPPEVVPVAAQQAGDLSKRVEGLQQQIVVQQKMLQLLQQQMSKLGGPALEELQDKRATLEARSRQAAQRDVDVAQAIDNLTEHIDAEERNGPRLPATLKELFLPMRTNETPLSIYGSFVENFTHFNARPGVF